MSQSLDDFVRDLLPLHPSGDGGGHVGGGRSARGPQMELVGRYTLERLVSRGGMGEVHLACQHGLERDVAVKVMSDRAEQAGLQERFRREAWVLGRLDHPNIVPVHDFGHDADGRPFYSMKLVRGRTLQSILDHLRDGEVETVRNHPLRSLLTIFLKVCDAAAFAHSEGIVHRDLKPENIMVGAFGEVLVMDWGLAKVLHDDCLPSANAEEMNAAVAGGSTPCQQTQAGAVMGTPQYMSPEQAQGQMAEVDERSDIFSLGGILYAMLTLRPPVEGTTVQEVLGKVREAEITPPMLLHEARGNKIPEGQERRLPHLREGRVPSGLSAVVMKALRRDKADRYASVAALRADVEAVLAGYVPSAEEAGLWRLCRSFVARHQAAAVGGAAVLVVGGLLGSQALIAGRRAEQALSELRQTAPVFHAQAKLDFDEGRPEEAIRKIGYAIQLEETNADYQVFRGNLNQSAQRLANAVADYRRVLQLRPDDANARTNLALCEKWLKETGEAPLNRQQRLELLAALRQQGRLVESVPYAAVLDPDLAAMKKVLEKRLQYFSKQAGWSAAKRVEQLPDGTFEVYLHRLAPGDLSVLKDQPISKLQLDEAGGTDISSLPRLPLKELSLYRSKVQDISPLRGLPLEVLSLSALPVKDLSPLRGMKLRHLNINGLPVDDITALKGMPLVRLDANDCRSLFDLGSLRGAPLEYVCLRAAPITKVDDLAESPLKELSLDSCVVSDLSPLARCMTLEMLDLRRTRVSDISPLAGLHLKWINVGDSPVQDISPLRGQPLSFIRMQRSKVTDVAPLAECPMLEEIILPEKAKNVELLRHLPRLRRISATGTPDYHPTQTAEEFWRAFDASPK